MKSENKSRSKFEMKTRVCTEDEYSKIENKKKDKAHKFLKTLNILKNEIEVFFFKKKELKILQINYEEKLIENNIEFLDKKKILVKNIFEILENFFTLSKNNFLWDLQIDSFSFFNNFFNNYRNIFNSLKNEKTEIFVNLENLGKLKNLLIKSNAEKIDEKFFVYEEDSLIFIKNNINLFLESKNIEIENEKILDSYGEKIEKGIFNFKNLFKEISEKENYKIIKKSFKINIFNNSVKFRKIILFLENSKILKKIIKKIFEERFSKFNDSSNLLIKQDIDKEKFLIKNILEEIKKLKFYLLLESKLHQKFVFNKKNKILFQKILFSKSFENNINSENYNNLEKENYNNSEIIFLNSKINKKKNFKKNVLKKQDFEDCLNNIFGISNLKTIIKNLPFDSKDFFLIENPNLKELLFFVEQKIILLNNNLEFIKNLFFYFLPEIEKNLLKFFHFTFGDIIFYSELENKKTNKNINFHQIFLELLENIKTYENTLKKFFRKTNNLNIKKNQNNLQIINLDTNIKNSNFLLNLNQILFSKKKNKKFIKKLLKGINIQIIKKKKKLKNFLFKISVKKKQIEIVKITELPIISYKDDIFNIDNIFSINRVEEEISNMIFFKDIFILRKNGINIFEVLHKKKDFCKKFEFSVEGESLKIFDFLFKLWK